MAAPPDAPASWRLCTPAARPGAVAAIELSGDVDAAFSRLGIAPVATGEIRLRSLVGIDRGVVARVSDSLALLMPHGGLAVVRRLCRALLASGLPRRRDPGSAFPEARSAFEARLLTTLAAAASPRAVDLLLDQPRRWGDHGSADRSGDAPAPDPEHSRLLDRLVHPPLVIALGASNIGKSTLLNRLAGREVAAVADEPGTTRDHVGALIEVDGLVVRYVDSPGRRPDAGEIETEAARRVESMLPAADLVLLLGDAGTPPPDPPGAAPALRVALRADLGLPAWSHDAALSALHHPDLGDFARLLRRTLVPDPALVSDLPWRFWGGPGPTLPARG